MPALLIKRGAGTSLLVKPALSLTLASGHTVVSLVAGYDKWDKRRELRAIGLDVARDIVVIFPLDAITSATDTLDIKESMLVEPSFAAVLAQGRKVFLLEHKPTAAVIKQETEEVRQTSSRIKAAEAHVRATRAEEKKLEALKKEQSKVEAEIKNAKKRQKETKDSNKLVSDAALKKQKAEHAALQEELKKLKKEKAEAAVRPQVIYYCVFIRFFL